MLKVSLAGIPQVVFHEFPLDRSIAVVKAIQTSWGVCAVTKHGQLYSTGVDRSIALQPDNPAWMTVLETAYILGVINANLYLAEDKRWSKAQRFAKRASLAGAIMAAADALDLALPKRLRNRLDGELNGSAANG